MNIQKSEKALKKFKSYYKIYDKVVLKMLPFYVEMHKEITSLINKKRRERFELFELGFGTGSLTLRLLKNFPNASVLGVDNMEENVNIAKEKLHEFNNFRYIVGNFKKVGLTKNFDYIVSALAIHHLSDLEKAQYFKKAYKALNVSGRMIIGDIVKSKDERLWHKYLVEKMGEEGEYRWQRHKNNKADKLSTITSQINWLKEAGFKNVRITKKWFNFYVFYGEKI